MDAQTRSLYTRLEPQSEGPAPWGDPDGKPSTLMTGAGSSAGWYPDPIGRFEVRYFDGSRWTEQVASRGIIAADPFPDMGLPWSGYPMNETPDFYLDVADGTYRIRSRTADAGAARSFAYFARRAYQVGISAGVVSASPGSFIGVGCLSRVSPIEGYVFMVMTSGGVALGRMNGNSPAGNHIDPIAADEDIAVPPGNVTLSLACNPGLVGSAVSLKGYLNGQEVITGGDAHGLDGFDAGLLVFENPAADAEVRFHRVDASVSGTGTSK